MKPRVKHVLSRTAIEIALIFALALTCSALDRDAFTFTSYDLRAHVTPNTHELSVQGKITLRNDTELPQRNASLQISSGLEWKTIRAAKPLAYVAQRYESDIDHTGAVTEAIVTLPQELAPKQSIELSVEYSGSIEADATRLTRIGVPESVALQSDWDRISPSFVALRGVGYVCWYPVSMDSVSLSEGNRYFAVLGEWKERESRSTMNLSLEAAGQNPIVANGSLTAARARTAVATGEVPSYLAEYTFPSLGNYPPTFSVGPYSVLDRPAVTISHIPDHRPAAEQYASTIEKLLPLVTEWLGPEHIKVQVVELTDPDAAPFDAGAVLFTPLQPSEATERELEAAHQLAHACQPPGITRLWISEGLAHFTQVLVREQQGGRDAALAYMRAFLPGLQAAEAEARGSDTTGQPLIRATDPTYYGVKAMFVWWMLRDLVGIDPLQEAIRSYQREQDKQPAYLQHLIEAPAKQGLEWFFDDWVYRDRGLPNFRIAAGFAREMLPGSTAITITVENQGDAAANVPVTVVTAQARETKRLMVPGKSSAIVRFQSPLQPVSAVVNDGSIPESDTTDDSYQFPQKQD